MLLPSLQLWQLPQPINKAVCAINIDDAAPRTVDIYAVAIIAASPHRQMLHVHPLLRITVVSTCCVYKLHPLAVDILLPLLWYFVHCCGYYAAPTCSGHTAATALVFFYCRGPGQLSPPATDSSVI